MTTLPIFNNVFYYTDQELLLPNSVFNMVIVKTNPDNIGSVYLPSGEFTPETDQPYFLLGEYFLNNERVFHPKINSIFDLHSCFHKEDKYTVIYPEDLIKQLIDIILVIRTINPEVPIYIRNDGVQHPELKTASQIVIINQVNQYLLPLYHKLKY